MYRLQVRQDIEYHWQQRQSALPSSLHPYLYSSPQQSIGRYSQTTAALPMDNSLPSIHLKGLHPICPLGLSTDSDHPPLDLVSEIPNEHLGRSELLDVLSPSIYCTWDPSPHPAFLQSYRNHVRDVEPRSSEAYNCGRECPNFKHVPPISPPKSFNRVQEQSPRSPEVKSSHEASSFNFNVGSNSDGDFRTSKKQRTDDNGTRSRRKTDIACDFCRSKLAVNKNRF